MLSEDNRTRARRKPFHVTNPDSDPEHNTEDRRYNAYQYQPSPLPSIRPSYPQPKPRCVPPLSTNMVSSNRPTLSSPSSASSNSYAAEESTPPPTTPALPQPSADLPADTLNVERSAETPAVLVAKPLPIPSPNRVPVTLDRVSILVTNDSEHYLNVDISGARDTAYIRSCIFDKLNIFDDEVRSRLSIFVTEIGGFEQGVALSDETLFRYCSKYGDPKGTLKFFVSRATPPPSKHDQPRRPLPSPVSVGGQPTTVPQLSLEVESDILRPLQPRRRSRSRHSSDSSAEEWRRTEESLKADGVVASGYEADVDMTDLDIRRKSDEPRKHGDGEPRRPIRPLPQAIVPIAPPSQPISSSFPGTSFAHPPSAPLPSRPANPANPQPQVSYPRSASPHRRPSSPYGHSSSPRRRGPSSPSYLHRPSSPSSTSHPYANTSSPLASVPSAPFALMTASAHSSQPSRPKTPPNSNSSTRNNTNVPPPPLAPNRPTFDAVEAFEQVDDEAISSSFRSPHIRSRSDVSAQHTYVSDTRDVYLVSDDLSQRPERNRHQPDGVSASQLRQDTTLTRSKPSAPVRRLHRPPVGKYELPAEKPNFDPDCAASPTAVNDLEVSGDEHGSTPSPDSAKVSPRLGSRNPLPSSRPKPSLTSYSKPASSSKTPTSATKSATSPFLRRAVIPNVPHGASPNPPSHYQHGHSSSRSHNQRNQVPSNWPVSWKGEEKKGVKVQPTKGFTTSSGKVLPASTTQWTRMAKSAKSMDNLRAFSNVPKGQTSQSTRRYVAPPAAPLKLDGPFSKNGKESPPTVPPPNTVRSHRALPLYPVPLSPPSLTPAQEPIRRPVSALGSHDFSPRAVSPTRPLPMPGSYNSFRTPIVEWSTSSNSDPTPTSPHHSAGSSISSAIAAPSRINDTPQSPLSSSATVVVPPSSSDEKQSSQTTSFKGPFVEPTLIVEQAHSWVDRIIRGDSKAACDDTFLPETALPLYQQQLPPAPSRRPSEPTTRRPYVQQTVSNLITNMPYQPDDDEYDSGDTDYGTSIWKKPPMVMPPADPTLSAQSSMATVKPQRPPLSIRTEAEAGAGGEGQDGPGSTATMTLSSNLLSSRSVDPRSSTHVSDSGSSSSRRPSDAGLPGMGDNSWALRPPPEAMYQNLDKFFHEHDLDKPVIETIPSGGTSPIADIPQSGSIDGDVKAESDKTAPKVERENVNAPKESRDRTRLTRAKKSIRKVAEEGSKKVYRHIGLPLGPAPRSYDYGTLMPDGGTSTMVSAAGVPQESAPITYEQPIPHPQAYAMQKRRRSTKLWGSRLEEVKTHEPKEVKEKPALESPSGSTPTFKWVRGDCIGKGTYGRVYWALNATTCEMIAVKQVEIPQTASDKIDSRQLAVVNALKMESQTLSELDHPNIVQYLGFEATPTHLSIFLEYVPGGSIGSVLAKYGKFKENVTRSFTSQILCGLEYLHSKGILHRDLKADNILVETSGICKISDFGISKQTDDLHGEASTAMQGTVFWMAPEVINTQGRAYNTKIDIWSVGCVVLEMWAGTRPWMGTEAVAVMFNLYQGKRSPPVPDGLILSEQADDFRLKCFAINPEDRPPAAVLRQHPYLRLPAGWQFTGFT